MESGRDGSRVLLKKDRKNGDELSCKIGEGWGVTQPSRIYKTVCTNQGSALTSHRIMETMTACVLMTARHVYINLPTTASACMLYCLHKHH